MRGAAAATGRMGVERSQQRALGAAGELRTRGRTGGGRLGECTWAVCAGVCCGTAASVRCTCLSARTPVTTPTVRPAVHAAAAAAAAAVLVLAWAGAVQRRSKPTLRSVSPAPSFPRPPPSCYRAPTQHPAAPGQSITHSTPHSCTAPAGCSPQLPTHSSPPHHPSNSAPTPYGLRLL